MTHGAVRARSRGRRSHPITPLSPHPPTPSPRPGVGSPADAEELAAHAAGTTGAGMASSTTWTTISASATPTSSPARRSEFRCSTSSEPRHSVRRRRRSGPAYYPATGNRGLLDSASAQPLPPRPTIVDLCTGSGALALALSKFWPDARIVAVDDSDDALAYARRNVAGTPVELLRGRRHRHCAAARTGRQGRPPRRQPALHSRRCRAGTRSGTA